MLTDLAQLRWIAELRLSGSGTTALENIPNRGCVPTLGVNVIPHDQVLEQNALGASPLGPSRG